MKSEVINFRVEPGLKRLAEKVLKRIGLTTTDAITLFMHQLILQEGLPFEVKAPNKKTRQALKNAFEGKNLVKYNSLEELVREFS